MNGVVFKGTRGGIEVLFDAFAPFETIKEDLKKKLTRNARFIGKRADVKVSAVVGRELLDTEKEELLDIFAMYFNAEGVEFIGAKGNGGETAAPGSADAPAFEGFEVREERSMFVRSTLRSGQNQHRIRPHRKLPEQEKTIPDLRLETKLPGPARIAPGGSPGLHGRPGNRPIHVQSTDSAQRHRPVHLA